MTRLLNSFARKLILVAAGSKLVQRFVNRFGMKLGAARFVAGQTLDEAVPVLRALNDKGLATNTAILGEDVLTEAEANAVADQYIQVLERIAAEKLRTNVALKLTHLGLDVSEEIAYANLKRVVTRAHELDNFVRIDMEYSGLVDATLRIYTRLREDGLANVGTVLQSYLFRTPDDLAGARAARAEPAAREGRLPRAGRDRVPEEVRGGPGVRRAHGDDAPRASSTRRSRRTTTS